ncbi:MULTISPECIES: transglycosylase SLT domain-containing protein [unclassified Legionella]|uniref:transglycosylase SLT domain-containing protein n=1 Tax=unclassified Legionella TaxID=2622702 RepID=UPI0010565AAA|nr:MULTISPECIES: transglycosylase SLT domain-containing protein [unclassified Legionella]MDI9817722.1 transglycosylase SLT domain-containing protein [Legionella sp. PL877]
MRKTLLIIPMLYLAAIAYAFSGEAYLNRFTAYYQWSQNLPDNPDAEFLAFIEDNTPLSQKLREKWLYHLANKKDWISYAKYYKPSEEVGLQCYALMAKYQSGRQQEALNAIKPFWLQGDSQPSACNELFNLLLKDDKFDESLLTKRIILALDKRNLALVRYLLKQYKQPRIKDEQLLISIYQNPSKITELQAGELHNYFYLYGLKRMVSMNMDQAIKYWQSEKTQNLLTQAQKQSFLTHLALYKAMRNHEDAPFWFSQIEPAYYNDTLLDWQIRYALKRLQWPQVEKLITYFQDKENPCWQYWLARSLEAQGKKTKAKEIYHSLAQTRHYYGFLASLRIKSALNFENEPPIKDMSVLKPYQPFTDNIKSLYDSKQEVQASRLLNDFISELPKKDKSALAYWIANNLQWHGKSVYLSNTEDLNNQLSLRFPLAYRTTVDEFSKSYSVSPEFIYAIIRQESAFRGNVVSPVGARGLMQIMPATASMVAKREKIAYADKAQLFSFQKNINIGVAYLKQLAHQYNKHPVLIAAAYNAGPRQVNYWLKNHPPKQIDIWIETLPWQETRNYLKNVIAFYAVYQYRMQEKPDLRTFMKPL